MAETIRCSMAPVVPRVLIEFRAEGFSRLRHQRLSDFSVGLALGVSVGTGVFAAVSFRTTAESSKLRVQSSKLDIVPKHQAPLLPTCGACSLELLLSFEL